MTVIMVTHERSLAERYANRLVFLGDGKLVGELENKRLDKTEKEKTGVRA
jgi:ABC-type polar amino acid transport system ATPase subunit